MVDVTTSGGHAVGLGSMLVQDIDVYEVVIVTKNLCGQMGGLNTPKSFNDILC